MLSPQTAERLNSSACLPARTPAAEPRGNSRRSYLFPDKKGFLAAPLLSTQGKSCPSGCGFQWQEIGARQEQRKERKREKKEKREGEGDFAGSDVIRSKNYNGLCGSCLLLNSHPIKPPLLFLNTLSDMGT